MKQKTIALCLIYTMILMLPALLLRGENAIVSYCWLLEGGVSNHD